MGLSSGCAGVAAPSHHPRKVSTSSFYAPTTLVTAQEALDTDALLERAQTHLEQGRLDAAIAEFRLVAKGALSSANRLRALKGWGTALDFKGDLGAALDPYSRYVAEAPAGSLRDGIQVRVVRILVYRERYTEAGVRAAGIQNKERGPLERISILAALALASIENNSLEEAQLHISRARSIIDAYSFDRVDTPPLDVASLYFSLGELRRKKAEGIAFDPLPTDFGLALEERCQLILDAQGAYSSAMRSQNAHWSSMSGVRVSELYHQLHRDLMSMPPPQEVNTLKRQQLFEGALRLRYSILLRKSLSVMRSTVTLLDRTPEEDRWGELARASLVQIQEAQVAEEVAIDALPYTRTQLQDALDDLTRRAKKKRKSSKN